MSNEMYDFSVPVFRQGLVALQGILAKAEAHYTSRKVDLDVLINDRLFPDMLPFHFQCYQVLHNSVLGCQRLVGGAPERRPYFATFDEIKAAVAAGIEELDRYKPEDFEGSEDRDLRWTIASGAWIHFKGKGFLRTFALQNFFFHITTAYDILRHRGVDVGKRDYMGPDERNPDGADNAAPPH